MGAKQNIRLIQILSILLGLLVLGLPACQKAKMTKKSNTRKPRVQADQDTAVPTQEPQVTRVRTVTPPSQPVNTHGNPVVVSTHSTTARDGQGEGLPTDVSGTTSGVKDGQVYQHPTTLSGANSRVVVYTGKHVIDPCKTEECQEVIKPLPPPPKEIVDPCKNLDPCVEKDKCAKHNCPQKCPEPEPVVQVDRCEGLDPCIEKEMVIRLGCPQRCPAPEEEIDPCLDLDPCAEGERAVQLNCPQKCEPPKPVYESKQLEFSQPPGPVTEKVDILFVMDTSPSIYHERRWIVEQLPKLINQLPGGDNGTDYKIGVLPGHSPDSKFSAKLFGKSSPKILGNKGADAMSLPNITKALVKTMKEIPMERDKTGKKSANDAGELGLLSLNNFLKSDETKRLQADGKFLRNDAALMVIFVADENDICHIYKDGEQPQYDERYHPKRPAVEFFNGIRGYDPVEIEAHKKYCAVLGDIPERTVYNTLEQVKGDMPMKVSGIVYANEAQVPHEKGTEQYFDENEVGRGYLELMALTATPPMDLALGEYDVAMEFMGKFTTHSLKFIDKFQIPESEVVAIIEEEGSNQRRALVDVKIERENGAVVPKEIYRINFDEKTNQVMILPVEDVPTGLEYKPHPLDKVTVIWQVEVPQPQ